MGKTPVTLEELKELLEDTLEATEENTKLLKAMRRDAIIGAIVKYTFWIIVIVASFYFSMKFIEPYLGMLQGQNGEAADYQALFEQYKDLLAQ